MVFCQSLREAVVNNLKVARLIDQNILKLEVSVHYTLRVQVAHGHTDLRGVKLDDLLTETFLRLEDLVEFASFDERHDKVESLRRLEQIVHTDQKRMVTREKDIFLQLGVLNLVVLNQHIFTNSLNSVQLFGLGELSEEHFAEGSATQQHQQLEVLVLDVGVFTEANENRLARIFNVILKIELVHLLRALLTESH